MHPSSTARVSNAVNRIVVDAVRDAIDSGQVDYNVLIHLEKDETGRVAALESNMAAFNRLRSQIADEILRRLSEVSTSELSIPVGKQRDYTSLDEIELPDKAPIPEENTAENVVWDAVMSLGEPDNEIFVRYYVFGEKIREIAKATGVNPSTVKTKLSRGKRKLKEILLHAEGLL